MIPNRGATPEAMTAGRTTDKADISMPMAPFVNPPGAKEIFWGCSQSV
jgi:hypothetical protein